jgi:hypothetical protein
LEEGIIKFGGANASRKVNPTLPANGKKCPKVAILGHFTISLN